MNPCGSEEITYLAPCFQPICTSHKPNAGFRDWAKWCLPHSGSISGRNALHFHTSEIIFVDWFTVYFFFLKHTYLWLDWWWLAWNLILGKQDTQKKNLNVTLTLNIRTVGVNWYVDFQYFTFVKTFCSLIHRNGHTPCYTDPLNII